MVNTDPLAAVRGVIESVVEVVCAPARAADIATKKAAERAPRGFFRGNIALRDVALIELSNVRSTLPKICGDPIVSGSLAVRKRGCESERCAGPNRRADTAWQRRSGDKALRKTLINTGISKPFSRCRETGFFSGTGPLFSFKAGKPSGEGSGSSLRKQQLFERRSLADTEKSQKGARKPNLKKLLVLRTQKPSVDQPIVHSFKNFWVELFTVAGKLRCQKHHDLPHKLGVWHVMCIWGPKSCRCVQNEG